MAENKGNTAEELEQVVQKFREEIYERVWSVPDWIRVQQSEDTLAAQSFEFETGKSTRVQAKWLVGLNISEKICRLHWKLIDAKGFPQGKVQVTTVSTLLRWDSTVVWTETHERTMSLDQDQVDVSGLEKYINPNRELLFKLKLLVMEPEPLSVDSEMKLFRTTSLEQLSFNFGALIGDKATADLKIRTSDGKELLSHKAILKAQCTVFESIFRSDLSENKSGTVNVEDIGSKTMGILLHYFYTGDLLPSWKDEDTVVEFTYAVGKYQLISILNLLDEVLGRRDEENATYTDVKLLELARKLGLKTAEVELVERIKRTTTKVNSGDELVALYGIGQ